MTSQNRSAVRTLAVWRRKAAVGVDVLPGDIARRAGVRVEVGVVAERGDVRAHFFFFVNRFGWLAVAEWDDRHTERIRRGKNSMLRRVVENAVWVCGIIDSWLRWDYDGVGHVVVR